MKKTILSTFSTLLALSAVVGCNSGINPMSSLPQANPALANRTATNTVSAQSATVLAAVSKRLILMAFQQMDRNQDGVLAQSEFWSSPSYPGAPMPPTFVQIDKNKDGHIDKNEAQSKAFGEAVGKNPTNLRNFAKYSWTYTDGNHDNALSLDELLTTMAPPPMPYPPTQPYPMPTATSSDIGKKNYPYGDPYTSPGYTPGYPYPGYNEYEQRQLKVQLTTAFNQADKNLDRKLTFSEFEDMSALQMLSQSEVPYPSYPNYPPQPITSAVPAYPADPGQTPPSSLPRR